RARCSSRANGHPSYTRITSNAPPPRSNPSSVAKMVARDASVTAPSTEASEPEKLAGIPVTRPHFREVHDDRRGGRHVLHGSPLAHRVVLVSSGEDVRRGQTHRAEHGAVGAAPDRPADRLDPLGPDRGRGRVGHLGYLAED